ncbi:ABC transporter substrate-binding protein [Litchfieldia alkalitelluris]|uniref:ABC transporter substrate-binding protein n=1 Tax=Litchfieldia alkalitelluris TaxID=304268 RepID=UPI000997E8CF
MTVNPEEGSPVGSINVVDSSPLNWLYTLFHAVEEAVGADHQGRIIPSLAKKVHWVDETTLELELRKGVRFHNNEPFNADYVLRAFNEIKPWIAPHPPGTWVNLPDGTRLEKEDLYKVRYYFPKPEGLALGKLRAHHFTNMLFWNQLGFGYKKLGTAEGHW